MSEVKWIWADADDEGFKFLLPPDHDDLATSGEASGGDSRGRSQLAQGGLRRDPDHGHLVTIVGRGGAGKSIFALQLVTALLKGEHPGGSYKGQPLPAAFYFTLEAQREELESQYRSFEMGKGYRKASVAQTTPNRGTLLMV